MLARSPVKKMMKEASGDKNVTPEAVDKMIEVAEKYIKDVAKQANKFVETANRKTISIKELSAALDGSPITPAPEPPAKKK